MWEGKAANDRITALESQVGELQRENKAVNFQREEAVGLQDVTDARLRV